MGVLLGFYGFIGVSMVLVSALQLNCHKGFTDLGLALFKGLEIEPRWF